jgi:hypothetical protein
LPEIAGTSRPAESSASELLELEELSKLSELEEVSEDSSVVGSTGGSRLELGVSVEPLSLPEESLGDDVLHDDVSVVPGVVVEGAYGVLEWSSGTK